MRLQTGVIALCATIVAVAAVGAATALVVSSRFNHASATSMTLMSAMRNQMTADMLHDSLRGVVFRALYAGRSGHAETAQAASEDMKRYGADFRAAINAQDNLSLPTTIKTAISDVTSPLNAYIKEGEELVSAVADGRLEEGETRLPGFEKAFKVLEGEMARVSEAIETENGAITAESVAVGSSSQGVAWGMLLLQLLICAGIIAIVSRYISSPIRKLADAMRRLAAGDTAASTDQARLIKEVSDMSHAFIIFRDNAIRVGELAADEERRTEHELRERQAMMHKLAAEFETAVGTIIAELTTKSTDLETSAASLSASAESTSSDSNAVAEASNRASANVSTVSAATDALSTSVIEITRQVTRSADVATTAVAQAKHTMASVRMQTEAALKIGEVIRLINDIAGQTNLLALNATIEAARAGEAGKGFAIVAAEVKALATQTTAATEQIARQINEIQATTRESGQAMEQIGETIRSIHEISTTIASAVEEQRAATDEIARNVQEAATGTHLVSASISKVSKAAAATNVASSNVRAAAAAIAHESGTLREKVDSFLYNIRTGPGERRKGDNPNYAGPDRRKGQLVAA
jgi:methyl-accepting chemotaxis protein